MLSILKHFGHSRIFQWMKNNVHDYQWGIFGGILRRLACGQTIENCDCDIIVLRPDLSDAFVDYLKENSDIFRIEFNVSGRKARNNYGGIIRIVVAEGEMLFDINFMAWYRNQYDFSVNTLMMQPEGSNWYLTSTLRFNSREVEQYDAASIIIHCFQKKLYVVYRNKEKHPEFYCNKWEVRQKKLLDCGFTYPLFENAITLEN